MKNNKEMMNWRRFYPDGSWTNGRDHNIRHGVEEPDGWKDLTQKWKSEGGICARCGDFNNCDCDWSDRIGPQIYLTPDVLMAIKDGKSVFYSRGSNRTVQLMMKRSAESNNVTGD